MKIFTLGFCLAIIVALFPSASTAQTQLQKIPSEINQVKSLFGSHKKHATNTNSQQSSNTNSQQSTNTSQQLPNKNTNNVSSSTSAPNGLKPGDIAPNAIYIDADNLYPFDEGAALVTKGDASALIDKTGKFIVPYHKYKFDLVKYQQYGQNQEGGIFLLASDTGAVNSKGKLITKELPGLNYWQYASANFIHSLDQKGNLIYLDAEGNKYILKVEGNISSAGYQISENIVLEENNNMNIGYKNLKDEWIVQPIYNLLSEPFSDGLACVGKTNEFGEEEYGFINKKGEVVIPFIYSEKPRNFHGGLAEVYPKDLSEFKYALIDKQGKIVKKFNALGGSSYIGNGLFGYSSTSMMDSTGKILPITEFFKNYGVVQDDSTAGIGPTVIGITLSNSQFNDNAGKIFFTRNFKNSETWHNEGYVDIKTKKIMEGAFQGLNFCDTESKLSYALFNTSRYTYDKAPVREGYINEDGVFVIVKKAASVF